MLYTVLSLTLIGAAMAAELKDISNAVPTLFKAHDSFSLGEHYDMFRSQLTGFSVVRDEPSENIRKRQLTTTSQVFEVQNTLNDGNLLIYARGFAIDACMCGYNATSHSNSCSYMTANQVGGSSSYQATINYYYGVSSCAGAPDNTRTDTFSPATLSYVGCDSNTYMLESNYAIVSSSAYSSYSNQGLLTFHYGTSSACSSMDYTDYKFSGFTACGAVYLPCMSTVNSTTYYAISSNSIGIKSYADSTCTEQLSNTVITATSSCYRGTFDDDLDTVVVQNYFSWAVVNYPITSSSKTVTLSKRTYGGLVAAVFIAFLFGIVVTTMAFRWQTAPSGRPMASRDDKL